MIHVCMLVWFGSFQMNEWRPIEGDSAVTAQPRLLTHADFDGDGVSDVVMAADDGSLTFFRGRPDALFPSSESDAAPAFDRGVLIGTGVEDADWLVSGDFDADGAVDLLMARKKALNVHIARGSGEGGFTSFEPLPLFGDLDALVVGDLDRADDLPELAVAASNAGHDGGTLRIIGDHRGVLQGSTEIVPLEQRVDHLAMGLLDDAFADLIVVSDDQVQIFEGRPQSFGKRTDPERQVRSLVAPGTVRAVTVGPVDQTRGDDLVMLLADGRVVQMGETPKDLGGVTLDADKPVSLLSAGLQRFGDVLVRNGDTLWRVGEDSAMAATNLSSETADMSALRLNADALADVIAPGSNPQQPLQILYSAAVSTLRVNSSEGVIDGVCDAHCTLGDAVRVANADPDHDVIVFADLELGVPIDRPAEPITISQPLTLDGTSAPEGFVRILADLRIQPINAERVVDISLRGLMFDDFRTLNVRGVANLVVEACTFQLAATHTPGLLIEDAEHVQIGRGATPARNYFATASPRALGLTNVVQARIVNNHFGVTPQGRVSGGDGFSHVHMEAGSRNIHIGGADPGEGNVFVGSVIHHVYLYLDAGAAVIQGNVFGTTPDQRTTIFGNAGVTTEVDDLIVGGVREGAGNRFLNLNQGFLFNYWRNDVATVVSGNVFGLNVHGDAMPNRMGVDFIFTPDLVLGDASAPNEFHHNELGVNVNGQTRISYVHNRFFNNGRAVDWRETPSNDVNDPGDVDFGSNFQQNHPEFTAALVGGALVIDVFVDTLPDQAVYPLTLHFYEGADDQGGRLLFEATFMEADFAVGNERITIDPTNLELDDRFWMTALACDQNDNCSRFSPSQRVDRSDRLFVVNTLDLTNDGLCDAVHCSIAEAVEAVGGILEGGIIQFNLEGEGPFTFEYSLGRLTNLTLEGDSQPGYAGTPLIEFRGTDVAQDDGAVLSGAVEVIGIAFTDWTGAGLKLMGSEPKRVYQSYFGVRPDGETAGPNQRGIQFEFTRELLVDTCLISGNDEAGVIDSAGARNMVLIHSTVGLNAARTAALPNGDGVALRGQFHQIGGVDKGNVIAGNLDHGILAGLDTRIQGNFIGITPSGEAIGNGGIGVAERFPSVIGGEAFGEGNIISGNGVGVVTGGTLIGNYIGVDFTGTLARPNGLGVEIRGPAFVRHNIISGNDRGLLMTRTDDRPYTIWSNIIGLSWNGRFEIPNGGEAAVDSRTGGTLLGNRIAGNLGTGVKIQGGATILLGNVIGVKVGGEAAPNGGHGVHVGMGGRHQIGDVDLGNVIAASKGAGIFSNGQVVDILHNRIIANQGAGAYLRNIEGPFKVRHNQFVTNQRGGLMLYNTPEVELGDNEFLDNRGGGLIVTDIKRRNPVTRPRGR